MTTRDRYPQPPTFWRRTLATTAGRSPVLRRWRRALGAALALVTLAPLALVAADGPRRPTLDRTLQSVVAAGGPAPRVIVRTREGTTSRVDARLAARGRRPHVRHPALDTLAVTVDRGDLDALLADPDVLGLSADLPVSSASKKSAPTTATTAAAQTAAPTAEVTSSAPTDSTKWVPSHLATTLGIDQLVINGRYVQGAGVGVAVIDSGIANTGDYAIVGFVDFVNGRTDGPYDDFGHGTHVAGLIASSGKRSNGQYAGVAPAAWLVGLKVLDAAGSGLTRLCSPPSTTPSRTRQGWASA